MATELAPGRPGSLTPDQEEKLRKLWSHLLQLYGVLDDGSNTPAESAGTSTPVGDQSSAVKSEKPRKKRMSLFGRKANKPAETETETTGRPAGLEHIKEGDPDDKYGQTKQFLDALASQSPESLRATMWSMVKHDHPDALVLRFLRARKWDVDKALVMLISTMNWRATEMHVDDDIMVHGEGGALADEAGDDPAAKRLGHGFLKQIRMGKSFLHGVDKAGRPMCVVRVRLHRQADQSEESVERYTVYLIETARMLLAPPVDTATIVFDMTGFSMANMDYTPVKFMIKCFEANYPESLGTVLVHKAPWIFQGIWKIIRGWLDPVVASKIFFTNSRKEMEEYVDPSRIYKELEGDEEWEYQYVEPVLGENDRMKDTATRDRLLEAREELFKEFEASTVQWIREADTSRAAAIKSERDNIAIKMRADYWNLDPYLRARSLYDRIGVIREGGNVDFYPRQGAGAPVSEKPVVVTSADDVD